MTQPTPKVSREDFAQAMRETRMAYDRYFMGLERIEPLEQRAAAQRLLHNVSTQTKLNTARKFSLQSLKASWLSWQNFWDRTVRRIEAGTFQRHVDRIDAKKIAEPSAPEGNDGLSDAESSTADLSDEALKVLHAQLLQTQAALGHDTSGTSFAVLENIVRRQTAALMLRYSCEGVDFQVAIKNGKPILKALLRRRVP